MGFFYTIFYQPIYNLLVFFVAVLPGHDLGLAIIALTILTKVILFPLTFQTLKSQRDMQALQPKIAAIKEQYKDQKEIQAQELMKVYKEHKVNPLGSCLPLLVQIPIFLAIFQVLRAQLIGVDATKLYSFIPNPGVLNTHFFGLVDLTTVSIAFAIVAAILQYLQVKTSIVPKPAKEVSQTPGALDEDMAASMQRMTMYFIPAMTLLAGCTTLPAGVTLYWAVTTGITIIFNQAFLPKAKK